MNSKKRKFATSAQAARIMDHCGWQGKTKEQLIQCMLEARPWTREDSANLGRIAAALESLAKSLSRT